MKNKKIRTKNPVTSTERGLDDPIFRIGPPKRVKPLAEVTAADIPCGFTPYDVATDCEDV